MTACCYCGVSLDTIQKVGSLLFGLITLIILIAGYFKFLQNKLRDKQLDTVYELIKQIQQEDWQYIRFNNFDTFAKFPTATLFDIAEMKEFDDCDNLFFWGIDIEPSGKKLLAWDFFFKYYSHPLLPISIAKQLNIFNLWRFEQKQISYEEAMKQKHIAIGRKEQIQPYSYYFYFSDGELATCKKFKQATKELKDAITNWAKKYGLDDLNITTSHAYPTDK